MDSYFVIFPFFYIESPDGRARYTPHNRFCRLPAIYTVIKDAHGVSPFITTDNIYICVCRILIIRRVYCARGVVGFIALPFDRGFLRFTRDVISTYHYQARALALPRRGINLSDSDQRIHADVTNLRRSNLTRTLASGRRSD